MCWKILLLIEHILLYWGYSFYLMYKNRNLIDNKQFNKYVILNVISNQIVGSSVFYYFNFEIIESESLDLFILLCDIVILSFIHSIYFYILHWVFHTKFLYNSIHYMHHKNYVTVPYTAINCHILEHIFVNLMSVFIGTKIWLCNKNSVIIWVWISTISSINSHSGFLRKETPDRHDYHHLLKNVNYGSGYIFMDKIFGTYKICE